MKDKTSRIFEMITAVLLGGFSLVMIIYAGMDHIDAVGPGMASYSFPLGIFGVIFICCIVVIIKNIFLSIKKGKEYRGLTEKERDELSEEKKEEYVFQKLDKRVWITVGVMIIYVGLWQVLAFLLSTILFVIAEAKILKRDEPIWKAVVIAVVVDLIIYIVFIRIFAISLPETFLAGIL